MRNINNPSDFESLVNRVHGLSPTKPRKWGTMTLAEMLVHCTTQLRLALGEIPSQQQGSFLMRTHMGKWIAFSTIPWPKGSTTPREMDITKARFTFKDIEAEKNDLLHYLNKIQSADALQPHPFFGILSKDEWGRLIYKHLDHHFKQFSG